MRQGLPAALVPPHRAGPAGHQTDMVRTLRIENMHCAACVRRVTITLNKVFGTIAEEVQVGAARVKTDAEADVVLAALAKAGYPARFE